MKKIIYFYIVYSFFAILSNMSHPITPQLFNELHFSSTTYGNSFALMAFFNFVASLLWAKLIRYLGANKMLTLSFIGYAFAQFLFLKTNGSTLLFLSRSLAGIFMGGLMVSSLSYLLSVSSNVMYLSIYSMIQTVGSSIGYFIGGYCGRNNYHMTFYIQIIGCIIASLFSYFLLEKTKQKETKTITKKETKGLSKTFILFLSIVFLTSLGYFMWDNWLNYYLMHHYQFTSDYIGYYKLAIASVSLASNMILIFFLSRYRYMLVVVLSGCSVMLILSYFQNTLSMFLMFTLLFIMFSVLFLPLQQNQLRLHKEISVSKQSGLFNSVRALGMMIGPMLVGMLYGIKDTLSLVMIIISFLLASFLCMIYFYKEKDYGK